MPQHRRAVLPCQERVTPKAHPLLIDPEPESGDAIPQLRGRLIG
jgi:hypothetical protein